MRMLIPCVNAKVGLGALYPFQGEHRDGVSRAEDHEEWRIIIVYQNSVLRLMTVASLGILSMECGPSWRQVRQRRSRP